MSNLPVSGSYPRLPQELMDKIVDYGPADDFDFLRICRLSSRSLSARAQKYAFQTINITRSKRAEALLDILPGSASIGAPITKHIRSVVVSAEQAMVSEAPFYALMAHINASDRHLPLYVSISSADAQILNRHEIALKCTVPTHILASTFQHVTALELVDVYELPSSIVAACSSLRELRFDTSTLACDSPALGNERPRLEKLDLYVTDLRTVKHLADSLVDLSALKCLDYQILFDCCHENAVEDIRYVLDACASAVEELFISCPSAPYAAPGMLYDMSKLSNLRVLKFVTVDGVETDCEIHKSTSASFLSNALRGIGSVPNSLEKIEIYSIVPLSDEHIVVNENGTVTCLAIGIEGISPLMIQEDEWDNVDRELARVSHGKKLSVVFRPAATLCEEFNERDTAIIKSSFEDNMSAWVRDTLPLTAKAENVRLQCEPLWIS